MIHRNQNDHRRYPEAKRKQKAQTGRMTYSSPAGTLPKYGYLSLVCESHTFLVCHPIPHIMFSIEHRYQFFRRGDSDNKSH